jgi:diketogulonate reductase-like aldo/keto reductase
MQFVYGRITNALVHLYLEKTRTGSVIWGTHDHRWAERRGADQRPIQGHDGCIDTAWPYHAGESETVLGRVLTDGYREKVRVATKLPSWMIHSCADMDVYLNAQLEKMTDEFEDADLDKRVAMGKKMLNME